MPHRSHLPLAVTYGTESDLEALSAEQLADMLRECDRWFGNMDAFRNAIRTEAGRTEWTVLTREDVAEANAARERVRQEIDRRHGELLDELDSGVTDRQQPLSQRFPSTIPCLMPNGRLIRLLAGRVLDAENVPEEPLVIG